MPLQDDFKTEKELTKLGDAIAEEIDLIVNEGSLENKKRGFALFIIDYNTGVTHLQTSCQLDDFVELLRFWVATEDDKKKVKLN